MGAKHAKTSKQVGKLQFIQSQLDHVASEKFSRKVLEAQEAFLEVLKSNVTEVLKRWPELRTHTLPVKAISVLRKRGVAFEIPAAPAHKKSPARSPTRKAKQKQKPPNNALEESQKRRRPSREARLRRSLDQLEPTAPRSSKLILKSKRGTRLTGKALNCNLCKARTSLLWRYRESSWGEVRICDSCKAKVYPASHGVKDAMRLKVPGSVRN